MQGVERAIQHSQDNLYKAIPAKGEHKNFILVTIECGFFMAEITDDDYLKWDQWKDSILDDLKSIVKTTTKKSWNKIGEGYFVKKKEEE